MARQEPPTSIVLRPSAKINLTLRVGPRRPDGFHDVVTLLQSIDLADTLTITPRRGALTLDCSAAGVPADRSNLIWRAANALWRDLGRDGDASGARLALEKSIPIAAGLGGGSADAAAALVGLNRLWRGGRTVADLVRIAGRIGSDVPFFLIGGAALGVGRGNELYPVEDAAPLGVVLIQPAFGVSTADAYRWLDEDRALKSGSGMPPRSASAVDFGWPGGGLMLVNDLEASVAARHAEIDQMIGACRDLGALGAAMTGSGSVVFGLFPPRAVSRTAEKLTRRGWRVRVSRTLGRRAAGRRMGL